MRVLVFLVFVALVYCVGLYFTPDHEIREYYDETTRSPLIEIQARTPEKLEEVIAGYSDWKVHSRYTVKERKIPHPYRAQLLPVEH